MRRSRLKIFLLYFAPQFSVYTKFGIDPEVVNDIYKKLHDLDYFLLRYGPKDVAKYVEDDSTVSKYYGTLPFY